ncbi:MAG: SGNH/GDSL hydrolase family protein [Lachnospiraceae bacterium]|nr:SGNH/GDSL hydrolase family protein [Lachnospiraceae bacterium]
MNNKENNHVHKVFQIVILVFAVIGMISVLGLSVVGFFAVKNYVLNKDSGKVEIADAEEETEVNVEEIEEEITPESPEAEKSVMAPMSELKEAALPETETQNLEDQMVYEDGKLTITFFGDSILDNFRDETGIANRMAYDLDATVYNLAIGGTCATPEPDAYFENDRWNCTCGLGMVKALAGDISIDVLRDCTATQILREHIEEIRKSDIFIIEYGINDFLSAKPMASDDYRSGMSTYVGAMREMVNILRTNYPEAKIIICQPSYIYFYRDNGEFIGDTYTLNNGPGSEFDYGGKAEVVANEYGTYFYSLDRQGIDSYNSDEMLLDGIHLSETGRSVYSSNLSGLIKRNILGIEE